MKYIYPNAGSPWIMLSEIEKTILDKIKSIGKPLKDWDITINYGIKTGLNEAFIIDGAKKDELIKFSLKNMEIIKPILRGRDIKKYRYEFADKWLLNIHNGHSKTLPVNIEDYPDIKRHLDTFYPDLDQRQDKGITPYNLRNCTYLKDFTKPKIVWQEICQEASFAYDDKGFYPEASTFFLTSEFENLLYLLAVFNSKLCEYTFKKFFSGGGLGENGFRYKKVFFETLPISIPSLEQEKAITKLVQKILDKEGMHIEEECREIDSIVYKMFQLTSEEIEYVESRGDRVCRIKYIYPNAGSPWIMLSEIEKTILDKIKFIGKPLKDWDITINYGIKTGLNEAFIIDGQKKDELIKSSLRNMEIINPILRGRDIKKYRYEFADKWLLNIPWHFPLQNNPEIKGASQEAESIFQKTYPVIHQHLESYKEKLENRNKAETGIRYEWYALQRCGATYLKDFTKLKIVWQRITDKNKFVLIRNEFYILNSMAFISNIADQKEEYLLGVLNSSLVYFWMQKNVHEYGKNGFGLSNQYVETLPIPIPTQSQEKEITRLVQEILNKEGVDIDSEQKAIDKIVYEMFQLSEEETEYVESI